jgi:hypothetical protein
MYKDKLYKGTTPQKKITKKEKKRVTQKERVQITKC